jgi:hypothetical protein
MRCVKCRHVVCKSCQLPLNLVEPWKASGKEVWPEGEPYWKFLPIAHLCPKCGLTWRAGVWPEKLKKVKRMHSKETARWGQIAGCVCGNDSRHWKAFLYLGGR